MTDSTDGVTIEVHTDLLKDPAFDLRAYVVEHAIRQTHPELLDRNLIRFDILPGSS